MKTIKLLLTILLCQTVFTVQAGGKDYLQLDSKDQVGIVKSYKITQGQTVTISTKDSTTVTGKVYFISSDSFTINKQHFNFNTIDKISFRNRKERIITVALIAIGATYIATGTLLKRFGQGNLVATLYGNIFIYTGVSTGLASSVIALHETKIENLTKYNRTLVRK